MTPSGTRRSGKAAWVLTVTLVIISAAVVLHGTSTDAGVLLAVDAVLLYLVYQVSAAMTRPTSQSFALGRMRCSAEAVPFALRESDAGSPGRAWPRAPGRRPR